MVSGVQYDLGLHGAVEQLPTPDTGWREAASEGCGKKFPPSDCKKLSILLFTTWQLIEIDNALHCFTFTRNLLLTFVFCPTYSTALGFFNLDITLILTKTLFQKGIKTGVSTWIRSLVCKDLPSLTWVLDCWWRMLGRVSQCQCGDKEKVLGAFSKYFVFIWGSM